MICPVRYFFSYGGFFMSSKKLTVALVEGAMMVALATVLSIFKIIDLPCGGSVTVASMLPMIIFAYRHGTAWGLGAGAVFATLQQLLGLNNLSYVTGWQSIVAVILLDYIVAYTAVGLGGIFRKISKDQRMAFALGSLLVCLIRYACHVISGATVWVGLSIPDEAALIYSFGYNATYMLPEAIILVAVAYYLGGVIDFSKDSPTRLITERVHTDPSLSVLSGLSFLLCAVVDVWLIAPSLQNEETGQFFFGGLKNVDWITVAVVTLLTVILGTVLLILARKKKENN